MMAMIKRLKCSCALCLIWFYAILGNWATWCNPWHPHTLSVLFIFSSPPFVFRIQSYTFLMTCLNTQVTNLQNIDFHFMEAISHLTSHPHLSSPQISLISLYTSSYERVHFKSYSFLCCLLAFKSSMFQMHVFYMPVFDFLNNVAPL